jgi:precorrin-6B C5,15-methyltransferase / cobalt-precorrin-6B C5,C15-methyltransferase
MKSGSAVTLIGIGDDGCASLSARAINAITRAQVLAGGERHLAFFSQFAGERIVLKNGISQSLEKISQLADEHNVCVLASGDPLFFGIGAMVIERLGREHVQVLPQPTSMQWAFAKAGLRWDDASFVSVHGRSCEGFLTRLGRVKKLGVFTDSENSASRLAQLMLQHGQLGWKAWLCENIAGPDERVRTFSIADLAECSDIRPLNVLILQRADSSWTPPPAIPFLHEDEFAKRIPKKGLITKREVRLLSLAAMRIRPDSVIWDIGAGSGSVSIEAAMMAYEGRVYAIEVDPEGVALCIENLQTHAVDNVRVIAGRAPEKLSDLETPDSVFIGGSKGSMEEILDVVLERLPAGGHVVANAVTLENANEIYSGLRRYGIVPEVTLLQVSRAQSLARYLRYEALNPIQIFSATKPATGSEMS